MTTEQKEKKSRKGFGLLGLAALGGVAYLIFKGIPTHAAGKPGIGLKWGENGETGPQSIVMDTSQLLKVSVTNPTNKVWTYSIRWLLGYEVGAQWEDITIQPGQTVELESTVDFNSGLIPGDVNGDGKINVFDLAYLQKVLAEDPAFPVTPGCDVNQDGSITSGDLTKLNRLMMGLDPIERIGGIVIGGPREYTSKIHIVETTTDIEFNFNFDAITIVANEGTVNFNYPAGVTGIQVMVAPAGTQEFVSYGIDPISITLPVGTYDLIARKSGYIDYETQITVAMQGDTTVTVVLESAPITINLTYNTDGIEVFLDEVSFGINPSSIQFMPKLSGMYTLIGRKSGWYGFVKHIALNAGDTTSVYMEMIQALGHIYVRATDRDTSEVLTANVTITGEVSYSGVTSLYWDAAPMGTYTVEVTLEGYTSFSQVVEVVDPDIQVGVYAELVSTTQPDVLVNLTWPNDEVSTLGVMNISAVNAQGQPITAQIFLDNDSDSIGNTPLSIEVEEGYHTINLIATGYSDFVRSDIPVIAGEDTDVLCQMEASGGSGNLLPEYSIGNILHELSTGYLWTINNVFLNTYNNVMYYTLVRETEPGDPYTGHEFRNTAVSTVDGNSNYVLVG